MEKPLPRRRAEAKSAYLMTNADNANAEINWGLLDNPHCAQLLSHASHPWFTMHGGSGYGSAWQMKDRGSLEIAGKKRAAEEALGNPGTADDARV
jgi:hypothetical protein